jgi:hypothetical protein
MNLSSSQEEKASARMAINKSFFMTVKIKLLITKDKDINNFINNTKMAIKLEGNDEGNYHFELTEKDLIPEREIQEE